MKRYMTFVLVLLFVTSGIAQDVPAPPGPSMPPLPPDRKKMEMMKMWQMTTFIDLTEEQAEKFFPRYKALSKELWELNKQQIDEIKKIGELLREEKEIKEQLVDKVVEKASAIEQQKIEKKQKFVKDLGDILTPEQKAKYVVFEIRFKNQLRDVIKERRRWKGEKEEFEKEKRRRREKSRRR